MNRRIRAVRRTCPFVLPRLAGGPPLVPALVLATSMLAASTSAACPSCPAGRTAREQVLGGDFAANLAVAIAPFFAMGLVARWAERAARRAR